MTKTKKKAKDEETAMVKEVRDDDMVPLSYFARSMPLARELLHQCNAGRFIDLSPNGCDLSVAAVESKIFSTIVVRNETHRKVSLLKHDDSDDTVMKCSWQ